MVMMTAMTPSEKASRRAGVAGLLGMWLRGETFEQDTRSNRVTGEVRPRNSLYLMVAAL